MGITKEKTISQEFDEFIVDITMEQQKKKKKKLKNKIKRLFKKIGNFFRLKPTSKHKKKLKIEKKRKKERQKIITRKKGIVYYIFSFLNIFNIFKKKKKIDKDVKKAFQNKITEEVEEESDEEITIRIEEEIKEQYKPFHPKEEIGFNL